MHFQLLFVVLLSYSFYIHFSCSVVLSETPKMHFNHVLQEPTLKSIWSVSLHGCITECGRRNTCTSGNYLRLFKLCQLNFRDIANVTLIEKKAAVFFKLSGRLKQVIKKRFCGENVCDDGKRCCMDTKQEHQCEVEECMDNSTTGNIIAETEGVNYLGAKRLVPCWRNESITSSNATVITAAISTCLPNGTWSPLPDTCPYTIVATRLATIDIPTQYLCSGGWDAFEDMCYSVLSDMLTWDDAKSYCESLDSDLVAIESAEQLKFLHEMLSAQGFEILDWFFSGGRYDKQWLWISRDGTSSISYTPSNAEIYDFAGHCLVLLMMNRKLVYRSTVCVELYHALCQKKMEAAPSTSRSIGTSTAARAPFTDNTTTTTRTEVTTEALVSASENTTDKTTNITTGNTTNNTTGPTDQGDCDQHWARFEGQCYNVTRTVLKWSDATDLCLSYGSSLATVNSQKQLTFFETILGSFPHSATFWLGGKYINGSWYWNSRTVTRKVTYFRWFSGENKHWNTNQCMALCKDTTGMEWFYVSVQCETGTDLRYIICEKPGSSALG